MILIISPPEDYHTRVVRHHLEARGQAVIVADIREFGAGAQVSFWPDDPARTEWRRKDGESFRFGEVRAVWYRRHYPATISRQVADADERRFIEREWIEMVRSVLTTTNAPFVNDPVATVHATKPIQLMTARRVGLAVPASLITNSDEWASHFIGANGPDVVHKVMRPFRPRMLQTKAWEAVDAAALSRLELAPTIFQKMITGRRELRITVIGQRVFAAEYQPQFLDGRSDFSAECVPHELPTSVRGRLLQLMHELGLVYGAIDMKIDEDGVYHFLEVNPQGQFLWIEIHTGMPLSAAMAQLLQDLADRDCSHALHGQPIPVSSGGTATLQT